MTSHDLPRPRPISQVDYTEFLAATLSRNKQMLQGASLVSADLQ